MPDGSSVPTVSASGEQGLARWKRLLFAAIGLCLFAMFTEGMAALYLNFLAANPRSLAIRNIPWHRYDPYRNHALGPGWSSLGRVHNSQGFRRDTDVSQEKAPNTYRIFLMGGSAAYGLSAGAPFPPVIITNEQTIDRKLEQLLQPLFPDRQIEVINAAVTAYWTHHHLIYLHEALLDYHPDLIIFLDGINDYYHDQPDHRQFDSYRYSMTLAVDTLNAPTSSQVLQVFMNWGKQHSNFLFVVNEGLTRILGWDQAPDDPCNAEVVPPDRLNAVFARQYESIARRTWVRTLRSILMTLKDNNVQVVTALQPELIFSQTMGRSEGDARLLDIERGYRPQFYAEKKAFLRPLARHLAQQTAEEFGATFVDLTDVFDADAQYYIDYCHLSEAGAERVAAQLLPIVRDKIIKASSNIVTQGASEGAQGG
ncbi:MAG TPA: GDSL-type esterase/lipase family protein [Candidatus Dormibacteraeota bacterium]|nr:GDSL-type esterase/lipase family protein [Candidatus Dormibacteraeota bacterium]